MGWLLTAQSPASTAWSTTVVFWQKLLDWGSALKEWTEGALSAVVDRSKDRASRLISDIMDVERPSAGVGGDRP